MRPFLIATFALVLPSLTPAHANDGFGGLSATGLTFGQTDAIAMKSEDLYISPTYISVDYVFANTSDQDVTGEVIFPLPPIHIWSLAEGMINLPEDPTRENLVGFTATVDGQPVAVQIDRIAVIEQPWDEARPASQNYDTPGRDVTADMARLGLPMTLDIDTVRAALNALTPAQRAEARAAGLVDVFDPDAADRPDNSYALWSVIYRYHWTQTFPAGADLRVSHAYDNLPPGGLFSWTDPPEEYQGSLLETHCIDAGTSKALVKALKNPEGSDYGDFGTAYFISYVLRTANSWAGPIGSFRLTIDKGNPDNIVSLCADGVKKTGPTTFVVEKTNYTPDRDLEILVVVPADY